jgi:hypothetical protein
VSWRRGLISTLSRIGLGACCDLGDRLTSKLNN